MRQARSGLLTLVDEEVRPPALGPSDLQAVADELNERPRKCLGWRTPADVFATIEISSA